VGNLGFIGYNGATGYANTKADLTQACMFVYFPVHAAPSYKVNTCGGDSGAYMKQSAPAFVFLLGHWNNDGNA
jgi:hypothetical protein